MEVLSHVNKRIKDRKQIKLPLQKLVDQFVKPSSPMVKNFALIYVQTAFERASSEEQFKVVRCLSTFFLFSDTQTFGIF